MQSPSNSTGGTIYSKIVVFIPLSLFFLTESKEAGMCASMQCDTSNTGKNKYGNRIFQPWVNVNDSGGY
jgi:hypothetical protein